MKRIGLGAALVFVAVVAAVPLAGGTPPNARDGARMTGGGVHGSRVVGYFLEWGIYGRGYRVKDVATSGSAAKLTAINYAFGNVAPDASGDVVCKLGDEWADYQTPWTAEQSVDGDGGDVAAPDPRQLPAAPGAEGAATRTSRS